MRPCSRAIAASCASEIRFPVTCELPRTSPKSDAVRSPADGIHVDRGSSDCGAPLNRVEIFEDFADIGDINF